MVINCFWFFFFFFFFFFIYEIFLFPFFETLNGTRRLPLGESREIPHFFVVAEIEILALSARVSLCQIRAFILCFVPKTEKDQWASSPSFDPLFRSNRHPVVWLAHQPLVIQNEGLTHTVLENSLPPPWTACFKLKQGNLCQQVSTNDCSSRLWDRICEYNITITHTHIHTHPQPHTNEILTAFVCILSYFQFSIHSIFLTAWWLLFYQF